jgi:colicin import membrane protein
MVAIMRILRGSLIKMKTVTLALSISVLVMAVQDTAAQVANSPASSALTQVSLLLEHYPAGSITSNDNAERALEEVAKERILVETDFTSQEQGCYLRFFTTFCLDKAKEQRRHALEQLRSIEIEANAFQRRSRVIERDRVLAEHLKEEELKSVQGILQQQEKEIAKKIEPQQDGSKFSVEKPVKIDVNRVAEHEAKEQRRQAEESANTKKRLDNIQAYEKKVKESEERQHEIAVKKQEKEAAKKAP